MTEIPEHLLKRSRERRSAVGQGGEAAADAPGDAGTTSNLPATTAAAAVPATAPAASGPPARTAAPAPSAPPAPK
ncbi:MAG: hypothetical protein ABIM89_12525, partial [Mycobacteriales bacterium]